MTTGPLPSPAPHDRAGDHDRDHQDEHQDAHQDGTAPAPRLVGTMFLFGRTSPPVLLFHIEGTLPRVLAHLAEHLDAWQPAGALKGAHAP